MVSVNQFEEVLLPANTDAGKKWRKLVLRIKNLVVQYMKIEMEQKMSQLAIKDERLEELEAVQTRLHATLEAQTARQAKKDARKAQQKTPLEKNYLLSHSPGSVGTFKVDTWAQVPEIQANGLSDTHKSLNPVSRSPVASTRLNFQQI